MQYPKWKLILIALVVAVGFVFAMPNFVPAKYMHKLPKYLTPITLGLDLQGGSQILLQVKVGDVVDDRMNAYRQTAAAALRKAGIRYTGAEVKDGRLTLNLIEGSDLPAAIDAVRGADRECCEVSSAGKTITSAYSEAARAALDNRVMEQSVEIVRRRIDALGTREPLIARQGSDRIQVQLPGVENPETVKNLLGKTAKMTFHFVVDNVSVAAAQAGSLPEGAFIAEGSGGEGDLVLEKNAIVGGESLTDSQATYQDGLPVVSFKFDGLGASRFGEATRKGVGRRLAIVLDGKVISAPVIQSAITGGSGVITGSFTVASAGELAMLLRGGALPAPLEVIEERTVGPGLGSDSIAAGKLACALSVAAVFVFMVLMYGWLGIIAGVALLVNAVLLMGALGALDATLTLPGIAGIALTVGMAVDANVLIYERIREEAQAGARSVAKTLDAGFGQALGAIFDSNITTLAAALFLFAFGYGPVRGFGITLGLGILTSMFTAVMVTRALLAWAATRWKTVRI
ncbi:hypothetical protein FACS1894186_0560 [Alphaproteobacteria bacterium]|nr:hypothetical protein FACS1894186_0560 [Alphaproteobacteria bacterium]